MALTETVTADTAGERAAHPRATAVGRFARGIRVDVGLLAAVLSAATFATSGPFAKALLATGWTPGSVVTARVGLAGLVLLGPALYAVRALPGVVRRSAGLILAFGLVAVAGAASTPGAFSHAYGRLVTYFSNQSSSTFALKSSCRSSPQPWGSRGAM